MNHPFWKTVSRETIDALLVYESLLKKWQESLNLISYKTVDDIWIRHFLDCAQLYSYTNSFENLACLGSGAGFPGAVLSILGQKNVTLIERDQKKAVFLRTVSRETKSPFKVLNIDVKSCAENFDCIVSRALAPINSLLEISHHLKKKQTEYFFLKGDQLDQELRDAAKIWEMTALHYKSITDSSGRICRLSNVKKNIKR